MFSSNFALLNCPHFCYRHDCFHLPLPFLEACWPLALFLSLFPPSLIFPFCLLTLYLSTFPSLQAVRGINISCGVRMWGFTFSLHWGPIAALLRLWHSPPPQTSKPCSSQSTLPLSSGTAGVVVNAWPWLARQPLAWRELSNDTYWTAIPLTEH